MALDGVVISANRSEKRPARMAPTLVNVVDFKMFETTNSATLSQGLNFQPGVRVETNCQIVASSRYVLMDSTDLIRR